MIIFNTQTHCTVLSNNPTQTMQWRVSAIYWHDSEQTGVFMKKNYYTIVNQGSHSISRKEIPQSALFPDPSYVQVLVLRNF